MTRTEMLAQLATFTEESNENVLSAYLDIAGAKILERCYPYRHDEELTVPSKYQFTQIEIAAYLINKRGAEGETAHNENGISRSYESASVPASMLKNVLPYCAPF